MNELSINNYKEYRSISEHNFPQYNYMLHLLQATTIIRTITIFVTLV